MKLRLGGLKRPIPGKYVNNSPRPPRDKPSRGVNIDLVYIYIKKWHEWQEAEKKFNSSESQRFAPVDSSSNMKAITQAQDYFRSSSSPAEKKLVFKLDVVILSFCCLTYFVWVACSYLIRRDVSRREVKANFNAL